MLALGPPWMAMEMVAVGAFTCLDDSDAAALMGGNWYRFFAENFVPE